MQHIAQKHAEKNILPHAQVVRDAQDDSLRPGEAQEVGGELVVDGGGERVEDYGVGREGLEVCERVGEGDEGAKEGGEGFKVEEEDTVDERDLGWMCCHN